MQPQNDPPFNILLLGNIHSPETRILCMCENLLFVGHYVKISFRFLDLLLKMGWASHRQISCENNPVLEPQRSRCPTEQLPSSSAVTSRSLFLSCDHVLCISYPDAHDWGQMFSTLNFALWDSVFSVGCTVTDNGTTEQLKKNFPMQCSCK